MVRLPRLPVLDVVKVPGVRAVLDGFVYLRGHPVVLMSFVVDIIAMVFGMPRALFPEIAHLDFGGPDEGGMVFALLFAAIPAGAVLGGVLSGWVSRVERTGPRGHRVHPGLGSGDDRVRRRGAARRPVAAAACWWPPW